MHASVCVCVYMCVHGSVHGSIDVSFYVRACVRVRVCVRVCVFFMMASPLPPSSCYGGPAQAAGGLVLQQGARS